MNVNSPSLRPPLPQPWLALPGASAAPTSSAAQPLPALALSDYWFLAGLLLALFYVTDPFMLRLDKIGLTKHLPLLICLGGAVLANLGHWLFRPVNRAPIAHWRVLQTGLPLLLLGLWVVLGSLYARKVLDINNTFITVGLYMLFTLLAARVVMLSPARASIVRVYLLAAAWFGAFMVLRMAASLDGYSFSYHELEALVIPLAVYFALRPAGNRHWRALLTLFFLASGLVFLKNTGFLVLALALLYIWAAEWRFRFRESVPFRFWTVLWLLLLLVAGAGAAGYLVHLGGELMPSGNPQYRMHTYEMAWSKFVDSPLWGTGFAAQATEKFTAYTITAARGMLATHSDILDLAAQGGVIALLLWLWGYWRILAFSLRHVLRGARPRDDQRAAAHALACMSLASIAVYAFNPILLQPAKALLLWSQLGMLLGLALSLANTANPPHTGK